MNNSTNKWIRGILILQFRHFPKVINQFMRGIKSLVLIIEEQFGQRDLGPKYLPNIDSFSGRRYANNVA